MHPIRRRDREIKKEESLGILERGVYGILALVGLWGEPYGVPLSYVLYKEKIYFHCARAGRKSDILRSGPRVCFTVVGNVQAVYENSFSTNYESVIVSGKSDEVLERDEKYAALFALIEKYLPEHRDAADAYITRLFDSTAVYAITLDEVSGKARRSQ